MLRQILCIIIKDYPVIYILFCFFKVNCQTTDKIKILNNLRSRTTKLKEKLRLANVELERSPRMRNMDIEFISQTAWINFFSDRLAKLKQRTNLQPVELHLLQEALLHRENRLDEELSIIGKVKKNFKSKNLSKNSLLTLLNNKLIEYLEVYKRVPNIYRQVVWGAIDEVKHLINELKNSKKKTFTKVELSKMEQIEARVEVTMKDIVQYRIYSTVHDKEFYN